MSADLYNVYIGPLLHRLEHSGIGKKIESIKFLTTACADDVTLNCTDSNEAQLLVNISYDFSTKQRYKLQPDKSVVIGQRKTGSKSDLNMNNTKLQNMDYGTHLGIQWGRSPNETMSKTVSENIKKSRRTVYRVLSTSLHGKKGMDPQTSLHLIKTYVLPVLLYGLEIIQSKQNF